ncbi:MAG: recombination protein RecR [Bacteroidales bacterium]|nr:recombination protein RecR [Bacteroidales bacterium]MBR3608959.1 recombination protein RecR [Bacteroidales bacterium]
MNNAFSSPLLDSAINEISKLPGIGKKSALRLVLHLLRQDEGVAVALGEAIIKLRKEIKYCKVCHNISNSDVCDICADSKRDKSTVCVVENIKDVISIENTNQFNGLYHVLGGIISPIDGISPNDIEIESLVERVKNEDIKEVILALSTTMEGDTTNFYIFRKLAGTDVKISILARGVSIGDELEYTDEVTLGRSILNRTLFTESFKL